MTIKKSNKKDWQKVMAESETKPVINHPDYQKLQEKLTEAEAKINEHWNNLLHAKADLQNVQRRAEQDVAKAHKYGLEKFAIELLPVIDSLERALINCDENLTHTNENNTVLKNMRHGIELTTNLFLKTLQKFGIEQVNPLGKDFNPELHEAMTIKEDPNVKPNTVLEVLNKGYTLNARLIRPALVIVAKNS